MIETSIIELIDYSVIYFDLGKNITKLYPGFREEDVLLAIGFVEETGEIAYIFSLSDKNNRRSWNPLDLNLINPLDLRLFYEELYCMYKFGSIKPSKEVQDYLYQNNRISEEYYSYILNKIKGCHLTKELNVHS